MTSQQIHLERLLGAFQNGSCSALGYSCFHFLIQAPGTSLFQRRSFRRSFAIPRHSPKIFFSDQIFFHPTAKLAGDGQFSMPITARGGSLLHADSQPSRYFSVNSNNKREKTPGSPREIIPLHLCLHPLLPTLLIRSRDASLSVPLRCTTPLTCFRYSGFRYLRRRLRGKFPMSQRDKTQE